MALILISPPAVEPVSLWELKEYLRVDPGDTSQDNLIYSLGLAARAWAEVYTQRPFVQQTLRLLIDFFPGYVQMKMVGEKISAPFVAGANAVLIGIRYAILLPGPPVQQISAFSYQNANGQTTSMISAAFTIAAITNPLGSVLGITTLTPHGLQSGASITVAGNAALVAVLGQTTEVITVTGPQDFTLNGTVGTGVGIAAGGTVVGYNFVQDIISNPARLTPVFGQMWPVARVVANAVQVDYQVGYAIPITISTLTASPPNPLSITASGYTFVSTDLNRPISIPGAGPSGGTLNTVIAVVNGAQATLRDPASTAVTNGTALLVNALYGDPRHWEMVKNGIKMLTERWYEIRIPDESDIPRAVKSVLSPVRELRL